MQLSRYKFRSIYKGFTGISFIPAVCSAMTLHGIEKSELRKLNKDEVVYLIEHLNNQMGIDKIKLCRIRTIQITLNTDRFWCLFTPWKFAYSYQGNSGKCCVFYMNVK